MSERMTQEMHLYLQGDTKCEVCFPIVFSQEHEEQESSSSPFTAKDDNEMVT